MNRSILNVVLLAAAGAATSWLVQNFLDQRKHKHVTRAKREIKEQLKTWEEEGGSLAPGAGSLAPGAERRDNATH